jgi:putative colanic acid biosysnthesis UDP-glucose lipid carrier transferase
MTFEHTSARFGIQAASSFVPSYPSREILDHRTAAIRPISKKAARLNGSTAKRLMDILIAATGLFFLAPLLVLVAIAIKLESSGPIFFRQERYGRNGVPFMIWKFRSMRALESHGAFVQATQGDSRITAVGQFLRSTSIDELPQLLNVLFGQMSIVGPRPHAKAMDDHYANLVQDYRDRHLVRPGLTGLAQIHGFRGPTDTLDAISARVSLDREYVRKWSVAGDIRIILQTPLSLLQNKAF